MDQSTVQTVGTTHGVCATVTNPRPSPDAGTALPTINGASGLASNPPQPVTKTLDGGGLADPNDVAGKFNDAGQIDLCINRGDRPGTRYPRNSARYRYAQPGAGSHGSGRRGGQR